jgi:hypothetical protein
MKSLQRLLTVLPFMSLTAVANPPAIHVWEMQEITFQAKNSYKNAYTDATVWVDLSGPGFNKKVYGFWDGGNTFRVRVVATKPGKVDLLLTMQDCQAKPVLSLLLTGLKKKKTKIPYAVVFSNPRLMGMH